jgi:hypothetical protein
MKKITVFHGQAYEIDANRILANDVILPGEYNPHIYPWLVISLYGPCGIAWARDIGDAIDEIVDAGLGKAFELQDTSNQTDEDECAFCGNDSRPCDLTNVRAFELALTIPENAHLIPLFKVARDGSPTLDF